MESKSNEITRKEQDTLTDRKSGKPRLIPPVDVFENKDEILVIADLPGVAKDSLSIRMEDSELLIQGSQEEARDGVQWQTIEFHRSFRVPNSVDPAGISAELKQGVLNLKLKKREEAKPKQIEVKVL